KGDHLHVPANGLFARRVERLAWSFFSKPVQNSRLRRDDELWSRRFANMPQHALGGLDEGLARKIAGSVVIHEGSCAATFWMDQHFSLGPRLPHGGEVGRTDARVDVALAHPQVEF